MSASTSVYDVRRTPQRRTLKVRGLDLHVRSWGDAGGTPQAPWVLLHGWQDTGDTFQFMVDAFAGERPLVAPDWRGFGRSEWPGEGYWFADYFADLEALLDDVSPHAPVCLVGHSMGGNIATLYAGLRPERVRAVASLEGFGLQRSTAAEAPGVLRRWLNQVKLRPGRKHYDSVAQLAQVVQYRYPRFTAAQAGFMAQAWSEPDGERIVLLGDPRHRWTNPVRYHRDDAEACWREVNSPVLLVVGADSDYLQALGSDGTEAALRALWPRSELVCIPGAGHMLHIEQAALVGAVVERFLESAACR